MNAKTSLDGSDGASHEELQREIGRLVVERQELRAHGASRDALEENRRWIAQRQRQLAYALIARYLPADAPSAA